MPPTMRVLLVEDDEGVREGLSELLAELARVDVAARISDALGALERERYGLVLTDLMLEADGRGATELVRAARHVFTPVVVVTGSSGDELPRILGADTPDGLLAKPFPIEEVLRVTSHFASLHASRVEQGAGTRLPKGAEVPGCAGGSGQGITVAEGSVEAGGRHFGAGCFLYRRAADPRRLVAREQTAVVLKDSRL